MANPFWESDPGQDYLKEIQQSHPHLVEQAKQLEQDQGENSQKPWWQNGCQEAKNLLAVEAKELHGSAYVPQNLDQHSHWLASVLTVANLINAGTSLPLLVLSFADWGLLGFLLALLTNLGLIKFSNKMGAIAAANQRQYRLGAGLAGLILMNLLQSFVAGVGTQLSLNQPNLSDRQAAQLVQQRIINPQKNEVARLRQGDPHTQAARQECSQLEAQFAQIPANSPERDGVFLLAYGRWQDHILPLEQRSYYSSPVSEYPWCPKANRLEAEHNQKLETAQESLDTLQAQAEGDGYLNYLRDRHPQIYAERFDESGVIRSSMDATAVAFEIFFEKFLGGAWQELGLSLYIFSLSVITSGVAVVLIANHAQRQDVKMSWSEAVAKERDKYLNEKRQQVFGKHYVIPYTPPQDSPEEATNNNGNGKAHLNY